MLNDYDRKVVTKLLIAMYNLSEHPCRKTATIAKLINGNCFFPRLVTESHVEIIFALFGGRTAFRNNPCIRKLATGH